MANYQELLSRAVGALPENNGTSRREVYEKARKALVAQLRAIDPPLPAREITQHRLELEDCIREVEHKATEELLGGLKDVEETSIPLVPEPVLPEPVVPEPAPDPAPKMEKGIVDEGRADTTKSTEIPEILENKNVDKADKFDNPADKKDAENNQNLREKEAEKPEAGDKSVEQEKASFSETKTEAGKADANDKSVNANSDTDSDKITAVADKDKSTSDIEVDTSDDSALDAIIARAENGRNKSGSVSKESKKSDLEVALEGAKAKQTVSKDEQSVQSRLHSDKSIGAAMSRVREVDNEPGKTNISPVSHDGQKNVDEQVSKTAPKVESDLVANLSAGQSSESELGQNDAQLSVDRAIKALDREALGGDDTAGESRKSTDFSDGLIGEEARFSSSVGEEKSSNGLTIFLVLVILLLGAVGGGGYWAWKQGYVDLENLFASGEVVEGTDNSDISNTNDAIVDVNTATDTATGDETSGPGNTMTNVRDVTLSNSDAVITDEDKSDERLTSTADNTENNGDDTSTQTDVNVSETNNDDKSEERLGADSIVPDASLGTEGDVDPNPVLDNGAQSLLLEASADGSGGAVPFSGTVEWSRGLDELGSPTLIGQANIPARNLNVKLLIRKNSDVSLPASHLMEIDFDVSETFAGGSVAGLPGILLKNEELVQGVALVGASARVVGNSFLFALSATDQDQRTNLDLLKTRKWMDLALIYASGRRAIITLEKDEVAQAMFREVLAIWGGNEPDSETLGEVVSDAVEGAGEAVTDGVDAVIDTLNEGAEAVTDAAVDLIQDAVAVEPNG